MTQIEEWEAPRDRFCKIYAYSREALFSNISNDNCLRTTDDYSILYIHNYLSHLKCAKIVVEKEYVDRDYLDDFAAYYVKCFKEYERFCRRLHFFREFDDKQLILYLEGKGNSEEVSQELNQDEEGEEVYLGYAVVKPLPKAIIGRTVLIPWENTVTSGDDESDNRSIRCVRDYKPNLAGLELCVEGLAFQEQDKVLAACATSALWSAFQQTGHLFGHPQPTQSEITGHATRFFKQTRSIPSAGLLTSQMCQAIREVGLEPEFQVVHNIPFLSTCYGYLRNGMPIVLASEVKGVGKHAVTLVGYHIGEEGPGVDDIGLFSSDIDLKLKGSRITKFYAHDDQIGPYSRLLVQPGAEPYPIELGSAWRNQLGEPTTLVPLSLIIPVYHKIRVPFTSALHLAAWMDFVLVNAMNVPIEWDIFLSSVNQYKTEVSKRSSISTKIRERILCLSHPRFFWRARAFADEIEVCEMLIDATDMELSFQLFDLNVFDEWVLDLLREIHEDAQYVLMAEESGIGRYLLRAIGKETGPRTSR